jgi:hypothetical protein
LTPITRLGTAVVLAVAAGQLACGSDGDRPLTQVFVGPVWTGSESYSYQLRQRDLIRGMCVLKTEPDFEPGRTRLTSLCSSPDGRYRDDREAVVESAGLTPLASRRVILDTIEARSTVFTAEYREGVVALTADQDGKSRSTTRGLPLADERSPRPGYYDDESLNWLVRGTTLREGYEGSYRNVNAGNARVFTATLKVERRDTITVPAGTFDTWRLRLETESITQMFWVEAAAPNRVIRARIERDIYELLPPN